MVKLGPDVEDSTTDAYSGYLPVGNITGFSMMHESGTGGAPKYGVVSQMPVVGNVSNPLVDLGLNRSALDQAEVGYYKSSLVSGVTVELAATDHAGLYNYTLPTGQNSIVVDVSHVLPSFRGLGWGQGYAGGYFEVVNASHYIGSGTYNNGWNLAPNWTVYFCGHFDQPPVSFSTFTGNGTTLYSYGSNLSINSMHRLGGVFSFNQSQILSRVGISLVSTAKACQNVESEIPAGSTTQSLVEASQDRWAKDVFSKVSTSETNTTILTQLYSYLYGMHLLPSNRTSENGKWNSTEPHYDDIFTYWDLFRCSTALTHVLQPVAYEEQMRSLVDIWRHEGWLPDARSSDYTGRTQGGSNADIILADAYVKGVRGGVDWQDAYEAMKTDAEVVPPNNHDPSAEDSSTKEGRGALPDWLTYGFITDNFTRAVTRAVEYSVDDFGLAQVASGLNYTDDATKYLNRSRNWRNHWNPEQESLNFTGFMVPRYANGSFEYPYDPLQCGSCYWTDPYYEALPWEYSWNAHHVSSCLPPAPLSLGIDIHIHTHTQKAKPPTDPLHPGHGHADRVLRRQRDIHQAAGKDVRDGRVQRQQRIRQHDPEPGQRAQLHDAVPVQLRGAAGPVGQALAARGQDVLRRRHGRHPGQQRRGRHADVGPVEHARPVSRHGPDDLSRRLAVVCGADHRARGRQDVEHYDHGG